MLLDHEAEEAEAGGVVGDFAVDLGDGEVYLGGQGYGGFGGGGFGGGGMGGGDGIAGAIGGAAA